MFQWVASSGPEDMGGCLEKEEDPFHGLKPKDVPGGGEEDTLRLAEVTKQLRSLRTAEHLDLATASVTEVYPRSPAWCHHCVNNSISCPRLFVGNRLAATSPDIVSRLGVSHLVNAAHPGPDNSMTVDCSKVVFGLLILIPDDSYRWWREADWPTWDYSSQMRTVKTSGLLGGLTIS